MREWTWFVPTLPFSKPFWSAWMMAWSAGVMASATPVAMIRLSQLVTEMPRVSATRKPAFLGRRKKPRVVVLRGGGAPTSKRGRDVCQHPRQSRVHEVV